MDSGTIDQNEALPFARYPGGGRKLLGAPRQGDVTVRHGYGPPVFEHCGMSCVYCGFGMQELYEAWLHVQVDHVVPRQTKRSPKKPDGLPAEWVEDISNCVTCCSACNAFMNQVGAKEPLPTTLDGFFDLRDGMFRAKRRRAQKRHAEERKYWATHVKP